MSSAAWWARAGVRVLQLREPDPDCAGEAKCQCKAPLEASWPELATTRLREIERWPQGGNYGLLCANLVVVDVDPRRAQSTGSIAAIVGRLPATRTERTPSGGDHYLLKRPRWWTEGTRINLVPGLDILTGDRAMVVAAPSRIHGKAYSVRVAAPGAFAPAWLEEAIRSSRMKPGMVRVPDQPPEPRPLTRGLDAVEIAAIRNHLGHNPSDHTYFVMVVAAEQNRSPGEIATILASDAVTMERWRREPHKRHYDLTAGLARALAEARESDWAGRPHVR